jgi:DNA-binding NtrC family response regulator
MARILIVDDELIVCRSLSKILAEHETTSAQSAEEALAVLKEGSFDVVFTDLKMPGMNGIELLKIIKKEYPQTIVIIVTGFGTVETAVEAMKEGALDYVPKPFTPDEVRLRAKSALEKRGIFSQGYDEKYQFENMIGSSDRMKEVFRLIEKVAPTSGTVMIHGESGTGKELVARAIHNKSRRKTKRFVPVDCGAFPATLLESALFGHVKGAFTGAVMDKPGFFEMANGGTLFIDEVGNISPDIQGKLLRALQEREFVPVGGTQVKKVNVRLISATNRDAKEMVKEGSFREDLFYRLYVVPIFLPPLRERIEDIPALTHHFLEKHCRQMGKPLLNISPETMKCLVDYDWPGNVRQLENTIERMIITAEGDTIVPGDLPLSIRTQHVCAAPSVPKSSEELKGVKRQLKQDATREVERSFLIDALKRNDWNVTRAAAEVGMQRTNFHALMRKHRIKRPPPGSANDH